MGKINKDDVVIIPAFGTTLEIEHLLLDKGVDVQKYNTTCPFVEKFGTGPKNWVKKITPLLFMVNLNMKKQRPLFA